MQALLLGEAKAVAGKLIPSQKENRSRDFFDLTKAPPQDTLPVSRRAVCGSDVAAGILSLDFIKEIHRIL
jgi:hypothetical protein